MEYVVNELNRIINSVLNPKKPLKQYINLSADAMKVFVSLIKSTHIKKGNLLVEPGKPCSNIYFITKGFARIFYYKDGKDITEGFRSESNVILSLVSLITHQPDKRGIEVLEPTDLLYINYREFEQHFELYPDFYKMALHFTNVAVMLLQKRLDGLLFESAQSRYKSLLRIYPDILQRLPLGMVASYLGITQETLSRIRARYQNGDRRF